MSRLAPSARQEVVLLALLLAGCILLLSVQVRRTGGQTLAESWALDATAALVRGVTGVEGAGSSLAGWLSFRSALVRENAELRGRVTALEGELLRLRDAERDRNRLLGLLGLYPTPPPGTRAAHVIVVSTAGPFQSAVLDRGRRDGVAPGGAVVGLKGLIGRVVAAGEASARVQLLSDRTAATGVLLPRTARAAVARGDGGSGAAVLYVPAISDVVPGDAVVTSGTDGVYPRDLPVGRIASVGRAGLFLDLPVRLATDARLEPVVFVFPPLLPREARPGGGDAPPEAVSLLATFAGLLLATLGTLVLGVLGLPSVPDLFLLPVAFAARRGAATRSMLIALAAGLLEDSLIAPGRLFGLHAFAKVVVAYLLALVGARTLVEKPAPFGALVAAGSVVEGAIVAGLLWILRGDLFLPEPGRLALRVVGTGLLGAGARAVLRYPWKEARAARRRRKLA